MTASISKNAAIVCSSASRDSGVWSGFETIGMRRAKCSLLLQEETSLDAVIKSLPKQRVLVHQDRGVTQSNAQRNGPVSTNTIPTPDEPYPVDFDGATILQLEPTISRAEPQSVMPITITVGGRCVFTPENYLDFKIMMRTKEQSQEMSVAPNGTFDWPDVTALLLCPVCGNTCSVPRPGDKQEHEYWMVFYPLLQITILKGAEMTLSTRTVCRLTCLDCMDDLLEGLTLNVTPGALCRPGPSSAGLAFQLPAADILAEAGSVSFLEDGPPRPNSHSHLDDVLDAWTLYNLWENSGAWEALQNDYRVLLSRSLLADQFELPSSAQNIRKKRLGQKCGYSACTKVHGQPLMNNSSDDDDFCRLCIKCQDCHVALYCSRTCRDQGRTEHLDVCREKCRDRQERRDKRGKPVRCDTCARKFPYTKMKKCSSCRMSTYCSVDCQRMDWQRHKYNCQR
jgi:MYND finger